MKARIEKSTTIIEQSVVVVVIVNWNCWKHTLAAVQSVIASEYDDVQVVVIDNGSSDSSAEQLRAKLPEGRCLLIMSETNLGFAGGSNLGIERALSTRAQYVFLLNPDAVVRPGTIGALVNQSRLLADGSPLGATVMKARSGTYEFFGAGPVSMELGRPHPFFMPEDADRLTERLIPTSYVTGAALLMPSNLLRDIGTFDERFFLYFEETDWCFRAAKAGHPSFIVRDAVVDHEGGAITSHTSPLTAYFMERNRLLFAERHCKPALRFRILLRSVCRALVAIPKARLKMETRPNPHARALGVLHYLIRRFGDCPPSVRHRPTAFA